MEVPFGPHGPDSHDDGPILHGFVQSLLEPPKPKGHLYILWKQIPQVTFQGSTSFSLCGFLYKGSGKLHMD